MEEMESKLLEHISSMRTDNPIDEKYRQNIGLLLKSIFLFMGSHKQIGSDVYAGYGEGLNMGQKLTCESIIRHIDRELHRGVPIQVCSPLDGYKEALINTRQWIETYEKSNKWSRKESMRNSDKSELIFIDGNF